ncbi:MAG TPA: hypothetical protein VGI97_02090 [Gemmatimonadaceae bacterium]|jgi:hypothetical protein
MGFFYHPQRPKQTRQARLIAVVIAVIAGTSGAVVSHLASKPGTHGWATVTPDLAIVIAAFVGALVTMLIVRRNIEHGAAESAADADASSTSDADDRRPFVLLAAVVAIVAVIIVALVAIPRTAHAQGAAEVADWLSARIGKPAVVK